MSGEYTTGHSGVPGLHNIAFSANLRAPPRRIVATVERIREAYTVHGTRLRVSVREMWGWLREIWVAQRAGLETARDNENASKMSEAQFMCLLASPEEDRHGVAIADVHSEAVTMSHWEIAPLNWRLGSTRADTFPNSV